MLKDDLKNTSIPEIVIDKLSKDNLPEGMRYKRDPKLSSEFSDEIYKVQPEKRDVNIEIYDSTYENFEDFFRVLSKEKEIILKKKTISLNGKEFGINDLIKNPVTNKKLFSEGHFIIADIEEDKDIKLDEIKIGDIRYNFSGKMTRIGKSFLKSELVDEYNKILLNFNIRNKKQKIKIDINKSNINNIEDLKYIRNFYNFSLINNNIKITYLARLLDKNIAICEKFNFTNIDLNWSKNELILLDILYNFIINDINLIGFNLDKGEIIFNGLDDYEDSDTVIIDPKFSLLGNNINILISIDLKENNLIMKENKLIIEGDKKLFGRLFIE